MLEGSEFREEEFRAVLEGSARTKFVMKSTDVSTGAERPRVHIDGRPERHKMDGRFAFGMIEQMVGIGTGFRKIHHDGLPSGVDSLQSDTLTS